MAEQSFAGWISRQVEATDLVTAGPVARLAATLGHDGAHWPKDALPPLGHWLFHLPDALQSELGPDGHPFRGGFLPPIPQPRRMWAGGRLRFERPIPIGATLTKSSTIRSIVPKGAMTFVTVAHDMIVDGALAVSEEHDIVYLPISAPGRPRAVDTPAAQTERRHRADETLLFRYSALTFNAHRIHYDLAYTREVELYPDLVTHGPLQAMLLIDHALRDGLAPRTFAFRARAPLYARQDFTTSRAGDRLWVSDAAGIVTMTAEL